MVKKRDRLKPKKKRLYRIDHEAQRIRWKEEYNAPFKEAVDRIREILLNQRG